MDWTRPLAAVVGVGIAVAAVGSAYTLVTGLVVESLDAPALVVVALVALAVVAAVAAGRRSGEWTDNPDSYW